MQVIAWMPRDSDLPCLFLMPELPVTSFEPVEIPAIGFDPFDYIPYLTRMSE
jgi:hypothetical protein